MDSHLGPLYATLHCCYSRPNFLYSRVPACVAAQPAWTRTWGGSVARLLPLWVTDHATQLWKGAVFAGQQATGLPFSAAAAFKPYGIDAVTLELPSLPSGVRQLVSNRVTMDGLNELQCSVARAQSADI